MSENKMAVIINIIILVGIIPGIVFTSLYTAYNIQAMLLSIESGILTGSFLALVLSAVNYHVSKKKAYNEYYMHVSLCTFFIGMYGIAFDEDRTDAVRVLNEPKEFVEKITNWRAEYVKEVLFFSNIKPLYKKSKSYFLVTEIHKYLGSINMNFTNVQQILNFGKQFEITPEKIDQHNNTMSNIYMDLSYTDKLIKNLEEEIKVKVEHAKVL